MIINEKMLCIPPYLSTSWRQVITLHIDSEKTLHVTLKSGITVDIPGLSSEILNNIFNVHASFIAQETENSPSFFRENSLPSSFSMSIDTNLLDMTSHFLQHDPEKANSPEIPEEIVKKLSIVASKIGPIDIEKLPEAEPHCNCPHCQIIRAIKKVAIEQQEEISEEEVSDEDLKFSDWEILSTGNNLYVVTNPLDINERYTVYLGEPIGCTCGECGCEHIKAVLRS